MKVYSLKTLLKIFTIIFISYFGFYIYEIYFNGLNSNYNFWCIQVESNFYINAIGNISLDLHLDQLKIFLVKAIHIKQDRFMY